MDQVGLIILAVAAVFITALLTWLIRQFQKNDQSITPKIKVYLAFYAFVMIAPLAWVLYSTSGTTRYYEAFWLRFLNNSLSWNDIIYVSIGPIAIIWIFIRHLLKK